VREPSLLLLDEPLSNLDAKLREQMRFELKRLQHELGITTLYVTHDQSEALALSDSIAVFSTGRAVQLGPPHEIYRHPANRFVADFVGATNFLPGTVEEAGTNHIGLVRTGYGGLRCTLRSGTAQGAEVFVVIRPEDAALEPPGSVAGDNRLAGTVENRVYLGEVDDYVVRIGEDELRVRTRDGADFPIGAPVVVRLPPEQCIALGDRS